MALFPPGPAALFLRLAAPAAPGPSRSRWSPAKRQEDRSESRPSAGNHPLPAPAPPRTSPGASSNSRPRRNSEADMMAPTPPANFRLPATLPPARGRRFRLPARHACAEGAAAGCVWGLERLRRHVAAPCCAEITSDQPSGCAAFPDGPFLCGVWAGSRPAVLHRRGGTSVGTGLLRGAHCPMGP